MWLELLNKIKYAIESSEFGGRVELGFLNPMNAGVDEQGLILLGRGETLPIDGKVQAMLKQEFYLETWVRSDTDDFAVAYESICKLESEIESILIDFRNKCGELNEDVCILPDSGYQIVDIRCTNKTADNGSVRPCIGTQYRFEARMYDLKQSNSNGGIY